MFKCYVPFAYAKSIFEIKADFFKRNGVKVLFIDLDNTLDSYRLYVPSQRAVDYIEYLQKNDIVPIIISNNSGKRVSTYANHLKIDYVSMAGKPFPKKILKEIAKRNLKKEEVMLVGDQLMTDVTVGRKGGFRVVLTEKIVKEDQPTTHFNRLFDRPIRNYLKKKNMLRHWEEI